MENILQLILTSVISTICALVSYKIKKKIDQGGLEEISMRVILRHCIINEYNNIKEQETISQAELQDIEELYDCYKQYGGNGAITKLYNEMLNKKVE